MKRILFVVFWVFAFAFTATTALLLCGFALIFVGLDLWVDFLEKYFLWFMIVGAPTVGLILGLYGFLPGTKGNKSTMRTDLVDLRIRLAFLPLIGRWFAPKSEVKDDDNE